MTLVVQQECIAGIELKDSSHQHFSKGIAKTKREAHILTIKLIYKQPNLKCWNDFITK